MLIEQSHFPLGKETGCNTGIFLTLTVITIIGVTTVIYLTTKKEIHLT
jgi:hypothetical protein